MSKNNKKLGLGRGLSSLLPEDTDVQETPEVFFCPVEAIRPSPWQPRTSYDEETLQELATSIREKGVLQPLLVRELTPGLYELVAGERRWRAAKIAGLERVPVIVRDLSAQEALELALIENLQREDLNPLEEAKGYQRLITEFHLTQEEIAQKVGKERSTIANALRLLNLPEDIQEDLLAGRITAGHARAILSLKEPSKMRTLRDLVVAHHLSVRQTEKAARKMRTEETTRPPCPKDPNIVALEEELRHILGTKVSLNWGKKKGRLVIEFQTTDQFEAFLAKLRG